jgi:uncharacterized protein
VPSVPVAPKVQAHVVTSLEPHATQPASALPVLQDMKVVIPGGSGQLGRALERGLRARGHEVVVLRRPMERWAAAIDGADAVINLAGRSVNCRYSKKNLDEMMRSRVDSTRTVGEAIARAAKPPRVWLQMSTATIYADRYDAANDEATGVIGSSGPWHRSVEIALTWEKTCAEAVTPRTRKVMLRTAMVMGPGEGGIFDELRKLVMRRLGGPVAGGRQFVSWIHEDDFVRAVAFLLEGDLSGPVNVAAPNPLPFGDFMRALREACGVSFGLPASKWMLALGAFFMRTEPELLLKSRRVAPGRLRAAGFTFEHEDWPSAVKTLL